MHATVASLFLRRWQVTLLRHISTFTIQSRDSAPSLGDVPTLAPNIDPTPSVSSMLTLQTGSLYPSDSCTVSYDLVHTLCFIS
jgi:hypothetical protein